MDLKFKYCQMLNKIIALFLYSFCVCFVGRAYIYANPDVWVKARITYYFEDNLVTQLNYLWNFDDFFSSRTIVKYDRNSNGIFESEELALLQREIFDPLSQFNYHVNIWKEGNKLKKIMAKNFKARIEAKKLVFDFSVPLMPPANPGEGPLITSLFDKKLVLDFSLFKKKFLIVKGFMRPSCKFQIKRGKRSQNFSQIVTLKCSKK